MSESWPIQPAHDREYLVTRTDARLSDAPLPPAPGVADEPPPGRFEVFDDRGVYLREHPVGRPTASEGAAVGGALDSADLPVTLYIHGLAGSSTNFDSLGTVLAGHTRGFSVDLPGFGRSDPPPGGRYSIADNARLLSRVIDRISPDAPVHLIGNSLGGVVAVALAARRPDRVRTLSLVSPAVPDLRIRGERGADARLAVLLAPGTMGMAVRRLSAIGPFDRAAGMAAFCYGDWRVLTKAELQVAADDLAWRYSLPWVHNSVVRQLRGLMRSYLRPGRASFTSAAARVTAPTLVVWGTKDRLVDPALAVPAAESFADHRLLVLPGLGHVAQMEDPISTGRAVLALWEDAAAAASPDRAEEPDHPSGAPRPNTHVAVATSSP